MNRLPPYSSARCSFISLPFLRRTHSSCLALEGSPILSPLSRTEIVPHQSDTQPPLPTTWRFQNRSAKTAIMFFRSSRVYPLIPQGLGEFSTRKLQPSCGNEQNERKARLPLLWERFCRTAADRKRDAFDSCKCGNVCAIRTALRALTFSQQGGHFSQRRSILHLLLVV